MKKSSPYTFEGMKKNSPTNSEGTTGGEGSPASAASAQAKSTKRRPRSRTPPRHHKKAAEGAGAGGDSSVVVRPCVYVCVRCLEGGRMEPNDWLIDLMVPPPKKTPQFDKMVKRSSPVKPKRGILHVSLTWENMFSDADRQSKLRCVHSCCVHGGGGRV